MKKCEDCKKEIIGNAIGMMSVEEKDFGRKFYVCDKCIENYKNEGKPSVN